MKNARRHAVIWPVVLVGALVIGREWMRYRDTVRGLDAITAGLGKPRVELAGTLEVEWVTVKVAPCALSVLAPRGTKLVPKTDGASWSWTDQQSGAELSFDCRTLRRGELLGGDPTDVPTTGSTVLDKTVEVPPFTGRERWIGNAGAVSRRERILRSNDAVATLGVADAWNALPVEDRERFFSSLQRM